MMNIKDVKPVSKTCIFFIQYVTLVTASNNELFLNIIIMYSQMKLFFLSDTIDSDVLKIKIRCCNLIVWTYFYFCLSQV